MILEAKAIAKQNDVGYFPELSPEEAALALAADETLLLAAEQSRSTDPEYWLDRARHFSLRRKDSVQAKHACVKGLAVAPAVPFNGGKGASDPRRELLTGKDGYVILRLYPINSCDDGLQVPDWLTRASVLAAKAGDRGDAIRLWRQVANIDLSNTKPVQQLVEAGLKSELIVFYEEMRATFPTSNVPPRILDAIR